MIELIIFIVVGLVALGGAITVVVGKNPVYAAMGLMATMFALAVFYVVHLAHFVAAVQIIVYAGAVMTLFLFVIMFVGVDRAEILDEKLPVQRPVVLLVVLGTVVLAGVLLVSGEFTWVPESNAILGEANGTVEEIGRNLIAVEVAEDTFAPTRWLLPFEATAALLIVASVGAIALAFYRPRRLSEVEASE